MWRLNLTPFLYKIKNNIFFNTYLKNRYWSDNSIIIKEIIFKFHLKLLCIHKKEGSENQ